MAYRASTASTAEQDFVLTQRLREAAAKGGRYGLSKPSQGRISMSAAYRPVRVDALCDVLGVGPKSFYSAKRKKRPATDARPRAVVRYKRDQRLKAPNL